MDTSLAEEVQQTMANTCAQSLFLYVAVPQSFTTSGCSAAASDELAVNGDLPDSPFQQNSPRCLPMPKRRASKIR